MFLAIAPLCMWDPPCTAAFCASLLCIACFRERTPWLSFSVCCTLLCATWVEAMKLKRGAAAAPAPWPHIIVAAASPFFIRVSAGTNSILHHRLSPSQTLETSLPVAVVMAILVLCWYAAAAAVCSSSTANRRERACRYSPVEETLTQALLRPATVVQLMILVPPYIAGTLALLLSAFRTQNVATVAAVLSAILAVRQACLTLTVAAFKEDWRSVATPECVALASALVSISLAVAQAFARPPPAAAAAVATAI